MEIAGLKVNVEKHDASIDKHDASIEKLTSSSEVFTRQKREAAASPTGYGGEFARGEDGYGNNAYGYGGRTTTPVVNPGNEKFYYL